MPAPAELTAHLIALADSNPAALSSLLADPELAKRLTKIGANAAPAPEKGRPQMFRIVLQLWPIIASCCALGTLVIAWLVYGVSPMHAWEELAHRQAEYERETQDRSYRKQLVEMHLSSGNVFLGARQLAAAKVEFQRALLLNPGNIAAELGLLKSEVFEPASGDLVDPEIVERRLSMITEGMAMLNQVDAQEIQDAHVLMFSGDLYESSNPAQAEAKYRAAIEADSTMAHAHFALGEVREKMGDPDGAKESYEESVNLSPWNLAAQTSLARLNVMKHEYEPAISKYNTLIGVSPDDLLPYLGLARTYVLMGSPDAASRFYPSLLTLSGPGHEDIAKRPLNQAPWTLASGGTLGNWESKRCYILLAAALNECLISNGDRASALITQAAALPMSMSDLDNTIEADLRDLVPTVPDDDPRIQDFRARWQKGIAESSK